WRLRRQYSGEGGALRLDVAWDRAENLQGLTRYADLAGTQPVGATTYEVTGAGRTKTIRHRDGGGRWFATDASHYDAARRLDVETDNGTATNYSYDNSDQLTGDGTNAYAYDPNGNRKLNGSAGNIGPGNRLNEDAAWTYTYDDEGNLVRRTSKADG